MTGEWSVVSRNMQKWMSCLPEEIQRFVPIIHLAIPGSHASASYTVDAKSAVAPDCQKLVLAVGAFIKPFLLSWCVTQNTTVGEQLREGIRYLDIPLAMSRKDKRIHAVHWLYGGEIRDILIEVDVFLRVNKREIVIIDLHKFYEFTPENHADLHRVLQEIFSDRLCCLPKCLFSLTLNSMWEKGQQIIVIYRDQNIRLEFFWPSNAWLRYRPRSGDVPTMLRDLERNIACRPSSGQGHCSLYTITPDSSFIRKNITSNLDDACVKPCHEFLIPWLEIHRPGHAGFNIIVADFVNSIQFCQAVVVLNRKLMRKYLTA